MTNFSVILLALGIVGFVVGEFGMLGTGVELEGMFSHTIRSIYLNIVSHICLVVSGVIFLVESIRNDRISWVRMIIGISAFLPLFFIVVSSNIRDGL